RADRAVRRRARLPARRGRALDRRDPPPAGRAAPARPRELRGGDPGPWRHRADRRGAGRAAADPPCPAARERIPVPHAGAGRPGQPGRGAQRVQPAERLPARAARRLPQPGYPRAARRAARRDLKTGPENRPEDKAAKVSPTSAQRDRKAAVVERSPRTTAVPGEVSMKTTADPPTTVTSEDAGGVLTDRQWLAAHIHDPLVRVIEVDVSPAAYNDWRIDGAVLWNVYGDLKDAVYRTAGTDALQRLVASSGIAPRSTVVFYGYAPALGLWL